MKNFILEAKTTESSRQKQKKRRLASREGVLFDLRTDTPKLFQAFYQAMGKSNDIISKVRPNCRLRGYESMIIQCCFMEFLLNYFPDHASLGKYKRIILKVNGYIILFKKFDKKGFPMNIKTNNVQSILNQNQTLDLFSNSDYSEEPILYFGYQKDSVGNLTNPNLSYIDENKIKFSINEKDIVFEFDYNQDAGDFNQNSNAKPKLRDSESLKIVS